MPKHVLSADVTQVIKVDGEDHARSNQEMVRLIERLDALGLRIGRVDSYYDDSDLHPDAS